MYEKHFDDVIGHVQHDENGKRMRGRPRGSRNKTNGIIRPWAGGLFCVITNHRIQKYLEEKKVKQIEIIGRRVRIHLVDRTVIEL